MLYNKSTYNTVDFLKIQTESKKNTVYLIHEYNLIGAKIYTHEPIIFEQIKEIKRDSSNLIIKVTGLQGGEYTEYTKNNYYSISDCPKGYNYNDEFLPYTATVREDLPAKLKRHAQTYNNCKLMSETHGGYLQFFHPQTKKVLRIAINSHTYQPS